MPKKITHTILIFSQAMELGGVERSLLGLLDSIDYDHYDVDLFLMRHSGELMPYWAEKIPISLDIPTLLRMSQLDLARTLTESIVKNGYFQDIATGRNAALITGRSSSGLLYLIFA